VKSLDPRIHKSTLFFGVFSKIYAKMYTIILFLVRILRSPWPKTALLFFLAGILGAYRMGVHEGTTVVVRQDHSASVLPLDFAHDVESEQLLGQFVLQTQALQKDKALFEETIAGLQLTVKRLKRELRIEHKMVEDYLQVLGSPLLRDGVNLVESRWLKSAHDGHYRLALIVATELRSKGTIELFFEGEEEGLPLKISYQTLFDRKPSVLNFDFEKYQEIITEFALPSTFKVERIALRFVPEEGLSSEYTYNWSDLEMGKIFSRVVDAPL
jgi:hypothetical protein